MPLRDIEEAGLEGGEQYPWYDKTAIMDRPLAILQAWGWLDKKFQVCLLVAPLEDILFPDGSAFPAVGGISFDAEGQDNPRRRYLDYFADPKAEPIGPVELKQIEAKNQQGWVWAFRKCAMPAHSIDYAETLERKLHRQNWKAQALAAHKAQEAARQAEEAAERAARAMDLAPQAESPNDLPF